MFWAWSFPEDMSWLLLDSPVQSGEGEWKGHVHVHVLLGSPFHAAKLDAATPAQGGRGRGARGRLLKAREGCALCGGGLTRTHEG